jgi:gliding motility-associated-like protein
LDPGSFGSYNWTLPDGSNSTNRTIIANEPGQYRVTLTAAGCEYNITTSVLEDCQPKVFAPNAIRPASEVAQNRAFRVFANEYVGDFQIIIFNRWGTIVYQSNDKNFEWDATDLNGVEVPQGLYAYIINFRSTEGDDRTYEQRGGVNVVR